MTLEIARVGSEFLVNTPTAYDQWEPAITSLSNGGFVITWTDGSIKAQVFDATGSKVGSELQVLPTQTAFDPAIAGLTNGGFIISWGINAQVFDATGSKVGSELQVANQTTWHSTITGLTNGGFVINWDYYAADGDGYGI